MPMKSGYLRVFLSYPMITPVQRKTSVITESYLPPSLIWREGTATTLDRRRPCKKSTLRPKSECRFIHQLHLWFQSVQGGHFRSPKRNANEANRQRQQSQCDEHEKRPWNTAAQHTYPTSHRRAETRSEKCPNLFQVSANCKQVSF